MQDTLSDIRRAIIDIERHPKGKRVYVATRRVHHGMAGAFMVGFGLVLALHDWHDRKRWLRG